MPLGTSPSDVDRHHSIIIPLRIHISVQNIFLILLPDPALHHAAVLQQLMEVIIQVLTTRRTVRAASQPYRASRRLLRGVHLIG